MPSSIRATLAALWLWLAASGAIGPLPARGGPPSPVNIYVALWFDTEDYILPQDDEATKRLAEMLTRLGVRATFKIVGEKARVLERRGRADVIAALRKHDIGYHSNTHSQQPTVAVYLQNAGWEDGQLEFRRREEPGVKEVERIFGVTPSAYGQPGSAWAPQTYPALRAMGIKVYLDEADHVGIDDQPFYYGGLLNVFKMRSNLVRMALTGGTSLADGKSAFSKVHAALRARGGGTISIYYHPNEWVQTEFWDAVNFSHGANPPPAEWKTPGVRPAAETERAFADFEQFVTFMKTQQDVRFVTATDLAGIYADRAVDRDFDRQDLLAIARSIQTEISFQLYSGYAVSPADSFALLIEAATAFIVRHQFPAATRLGTLDGPTRAVSRAADARSTSFPWPAFAATVVDTAAYCRAHGRMPDEIWIGSDGLSPADYAATLAAVVEGLITSGDVPSRVERRVGRFTADTYVAEDSPRLWNWIIFPEGFHAPHLMELARLQAWTLKVAVLQQ